MLHPQALWALALALPIVAVFLYRGRKRRFLVPSLAIWREALGPEGKPRGWTRLREWFLLALNLGLLILLVTSAAAPGQGKESAGAEHWAFLVDVSPSMAAVDAGGRRIDQARAAVADLVARLPPEAWVTLAAAGASPVVTGPFPAASEELPKRIAALDWRPGPCRPQSLWRDLRPHPDAHAFHVVFVSDGAGIEGLAGFLEDPHHHFVKIGQDAANVGIVGVALERSWGDATAELAIELRNGGAEKAERSWRVLVNGKEIGKGTVTVPTGPEGAVVATAVPTYLSGLLEIRLEPGDAAPLDDRAFLALAPLVKPWVWVVIGEKESPFLAPVLGALQEHLDREASGKVAAANFRAEMLPASGIGLVVFDGADVPAALPPGNYLFFASGGDGLPVKVGPPADAPTIGRWAVGHPFLRNTSLELLQVARSRRVFPGRGDETLLEAVDGALAATGAGAGRAWVYFGFRLEESNLPVLVAYPLLIKNIVSWFAGKRAWIFSSAYRCGEAVRPEGAGAGAPAFSLRSAEGGDAWTVSVAGGELALDAPLRPGWVLAEAGGLRSAFGVNLFDPGEIDVRPSMLPARPPALAERPQGGAETPPWVRLALWALLLLGVEWILFHAWKAR